MRAYVIFLNKELTALDGTKKTMRGYYIKEWGMGFMHTEDIEKAKIYKTKTGASACIDLPVLRHYNPQILPVEITISLNFMVSSV